MKFFGDAEWYALLRTDHHEGLPRVASRRCGSYRCGVCPVLVVTICVQRLPGRSYFVVRRPRMLCMMLCCGVVVVVVIVVVVLLLCVMLLCGTPPVVSGAQGTQ